MRPLICALAFLAMTSVAEATDAATQDAVQSVIGRQIEAFRHDDAAGAYAFAGPLIQTMFPTPEAFAAMVQRGYPPVYRARSFAFGKVEDAADGAVAQSVQIQDEAGADWLALYTLERAADGAWRITGCTLVKAPGTAV